MSFFEGAFLEKMYTLPIYLIRDLENFIKVEEVDKFRYLNFDRVDTLVEASQEKAKLDAIHEQESLLPSK